ncbi:PREDICTED: golgin subfamily A member 1 isoform X1 [Theobroma cacao]|uniref:Golgin subfamily A member 1 isoform X1 n=1 Tax=Theobroma cacao TaxID=3641 RepID=A0AB32VXJ0_THECC|nr:PREDICTED: golgin subfamily A member 1 isoform X1 [Theobroma cacao]XP_017970125.1 PREDICTED: golgin subfamily A member 1 isoform X1 [Theobroma cacao]
MEMELLKLSKFKLQLRALVTESRDLRERERCATEQIHLLIQKQKQTEEEYSRRIQELQAELASSNESHQKLERKVSYLHNDNALLENKQKELQGTIQSLLQSRDSFVNAYQESTCEMKQSIEARDRKLTVLSEKINSHLSLFDSIEKEAFSVKQVVDNVQRTVSEKEEIVSGLRRKMDQVSAFGKAFVEKIHDLEKRLQNDEYEFQRKNKIISELEAQLEVAKISDCSRAQIEELQKTISANDTVIQNLIAQKEALHFEVTSLANILQKIQNAVANMNEEDRRVFSSMLETQEECKMVTPKEDNRIRDTIRDSAEQSPHKSCSMDAAENRAFQLSRGYNSTGNHWQANNASNSCVSESACSPLSACSESQPRANVVSISVNERKDNCTISVHQLDLECSTTQAETSKDPDAEA